MAPLGPFGYLVTWKTSLPQRVLEHLMADYKGQLNEKEMSSVQDGTDEGNDSLHWGEEWQEPANKDLRMDWVCLMADHSYHVDVGYLGVEHRVQKMVEVELRVH